MPELRKLLQILFQINPQPSLTSQLLQDDKLLQQKEIIEKTIPKPLDNNKLLSGTTILGNGNVCLVVDVPAITQILFRSKSKMKEVINEALV